MTGRKETKGEQADGGRDALVSGLPDPALLIEEPPRSERSGEPTAATASGGAEKNGRGE